MGQVHYRVPHWRNPATSNQQYLLRRLMEEAFGKDRDLRMGVLSYIVEAPIHGSADLLKWEAHILIEFLRDKRNGGLSANGRSFLERARFIVSQRPETGSHEDQAGQGTQSRVSDLRAAGGLQRGRDA